jgi:hypothetical protein
VGLFAAFVAAVVAFAAPRIFSGSGPGPNAETRLQEAEEDLLKAQETIREIEETLPCEPPSCASWSAVYQPPPVRKPAGHAAPEKVPPRGH